MENSDNKQITSSIVLKFFRHGERNKSEGEYEAELTQLGREQAHNAGEENPDIKYSLAFGSFRVKSGETALRVMLGKNNPFGSEKDDFEAILNNINDNVLVESSSKLGLDKRLDFKIDESEETGKLAVKAVAAGKGFEWIVKESDATAKENGDVHTSTYSKIAANFASIVEKYYQTANDWNDFVINNVDCSKELKRFFGNHGTLGESFLAKVIEKTKGIKERDNFIDALLGNHFDYVEGFSVTIEYMGRDKKILVEYHKGKNNGNDGFDFKEFIPNEVIEEIIKEGSI